MLHGKIEVNEIPVGAWEAARLDRVMNNAYRYDCKVYYRNNEGHPLHAEFTVVHFEKMGALSLASLVIGTGLKKLKGYPPGQPTEFPV